MRCLSNVVDRAKEYYQRFTNRIEKIPFNRTLENYLRKHPRLGLNIAGLATIGLSLSIGSTVLDGIDAAYSINNGTLSTAMKAYLIAGARKLSFEQVYPNPTFGFGALCLRETFQLTQ